MKDTDHSSNTGPEEPEAPFDAELTGEPDRELEELDGYVNLGMTKEALHLARRILGREPLSVEAFTNAVMAMLIHEDNCRPWTPPVEAAYNRLPTSEKPAVRLTMLGFYWSCHNATKAAEFVSLQPENATDFMAAMDVLLALDKLDAAKSLVPIGQKHLASSEDPSEQSLLMESLASCYARCGKWGAALALWRKAPLTQPMVRNALTSVVEIYAARALAVAREASHVAESLEKQDDELDLMLPGNRAGILKDTKDELLHLEKALSKVVPEKRQKEFGLAVNGIG